jgi:hypothetical protein
MNHQPMTLQALVAQSDNQLSIEFRDNRKSWSLTSLLKQEDVTLKIVRDM